MVPEAAPSRAPTTMTADARAQAEDKPFCVHHSSQPTQTSWVTKEVSTQVHLPLRRPIELTPKTRRVSTQDVQHQLDLEGAFQEDHRGQGRDVRSAIVGNNGAVPRILSAS